MRFATLVGPELQELVREDPDALNEFLEELHPEDIADIIDDLDADAAATVISHLTAEIAAPIFERLEQSRQEELLARLDSRIAGPLVGSMASDDRADLVQELEAEPRAKLLAALEPDDARDARALSEYSEHSAGGLMTTGFIGIAENMTVREAIELIRKRADNVETVYYVYVLRGLPVETDTGSSESAEGPYKLLGVASLRDLLLADWSQPICDVMTENVITVQPDLDQEEVARTIAKYDLSAVPVVDKYGRLLGVITFDDVMDVLIAEQTEDVQKLAGVEPVEDRYFATGFWRFISARARWLIALFVGEFFTGTALSRYEDAFHAVTTLVMFIPLVISSGGNSGSQSATIVIRAMAVGDIRDGDALRVVRRELGQGLVLGLILGAIGFVRTLLWRPVIAHQVSIAAIIALTLVVVVTIGTVVGSALPMFLKRLRVDPAVSSTPFIASLVDVLGIVAYFSIAKAILGAVLTTGRH